jgi:hypothetical protein
MSVSRPFNKRMDVRNSTKVLRSRVINVLTTVKHVAGGRLPHIMLSSGLAWERLSIFQYFLQFVGGSNN